MPFPPQDSLQQQQQLRQQGSQHSSIPEFQQDDSNSKEQPSYPQQFNNNTAEASLTSSQDNIDDLFPDNPDVARASRRIRKILDRRREREIAQWPCIRRFLHITFYDPSSLRARLFMTLSTTVLIFFLIVFMLDTMPQYRVREQWRQIAGYVNLSTAIFFTVEWVLRFYAFRHPLRYLYQPMTIVDVIGIFPGYIYYTTNDTNTFGKVKWLRALQILRILRVLRLTAYSVELYVTIRTLKKSLLQIAVVMVIILIMLLTGCFLLFYAENDSLDAANVRWLRKNHGVVEPSPFQNVFFCIYWGVVTVTTVGYGDYTPVSPWGQVIACLTMIVGVFTIVFPTSIISNNFATEWDAFHKAQKLLEKRVLRQENERKRYELSRAQFLASLDYDFPIDSSADTKARGATDSMMDTGQQHQNNQTSLTFNDFSSPDEEDIGTQHSLARMAPFEYSRMIDIANKVERDLGIPGISLKQVDSESEVNQNLVASAMYSKLYNDAFTALGERMLLRIILLSGLDNVEQLVQYLQNSQSTTNSSIREWPNEKKLSMLEYKLLNFLYNRISEDINAQAGISGLRSNVDITGSSGHHYSSFIHHRHKSSTGGKPLGVTRTASSNHGSFPRSPDISSMATSRYPKTVKRRLKSRIHQAYHNLPFTHDHPSQTTSHRYAQSVGQSSVRRSKLRNTTDPLTFEDDNFSSSNHSPILELGGSSDKESQSSHLVTNK